MIVDALGKLLGVGICLARKIDREVFGEPFEYESRTTLPDVARAGAPCACRATCGDIDEHDDSPHAVCRDLPR